jgi:DNA-binding GntR family transcriptional regulator
MNVQQICEALEIRMVLEYHAAKLAVPNVAECDFEAMGSIRAACARSETVSDWVEYNGQFHSARSAPANNMRLRRPIEEDGLHTDCSTPVASSEASGRDRPMYDHCKLHAACAMGRGPCLCPPSILSTRSRNCWSRPQQIRSAA